MEKLKITVDDKGVFRVWKDGIELKQLIAVKFEGEAGFNNTPKLTVTQGIVGGKSEPVNTIVQSIEYAAKRYGV